MSIRIPQNSPQVFTKRFDDVGSGVYYLGEALAGSLTSENVWRIQKIVESGADLSITFANGNADFNNIWDNRLSLNYS